MSKTFKIFLVGEVSTGKSSLLNAIAGGFISNASKQRETIHPEIYSFVSNKKMKAYPSFKKIASQLEKKHIDNKKIIPTKELFDNIKTQKMITDSESEPIEFKSRFDMGNFMIVDFPGLNNSTDAGEVFFKLIEHNIADCDCLVYVTKSESAFINQSEFNTFTRLKNLRDARKKDNGQYIKLCIVVNKFDDEYDSDLIEIAENINKKINDNNIPIFRISSHKLLITNIIKHKTNVPIPKFIKPDIQKIFQNANVITTKEQKQSIQKNGKINYRFVEYNENIDSENDDKYSPGKKSITKVTKRIVPGKSSDFPIRIRIRF